MFSLSGNVAFTTSIIKREGKYLIREDDTWIREKIIPLLGGTRQVSTGHQVEEFSIDRPACDLIVIGSPRYNEFAELIQKNFDMPYEYLFASLGADPGCRILKIVSEHGDELTSPRDHRVATTEFEIDYGIFFFANLSNSKKVFWISGIHGPGSVGVFQYLQENAGLVRPALGTKENTGTACLLRIKYRSDVRDHSSRITEVELLGKPRECVRKKSNLAPKALICDLGGVIMYFDRTRTYRALGHFLGMSFESVRDKIERTDLRQRYEIGGLTDEEFCAELSQTIGDRERRLTLDLVSEFWGDIFWPNNEMFDALGSLKRQGVALVLLSNTNHLHFHDIEKDYPDLLHLFDGMVLSYEEKKLKPDHALFAKAIEKVREIRPGAAVEDILYVDDNEEIANAAIDMGMKGFVFRSYSQFVFWTRRMGLYIP